MGLVFLLPRSIAYVNTFLESESNQQSHIGANGMIPEVKTHRKRI